MVQAKLHTIHIHELLIVKLDSKEVTAKVTRIMATYDGKTPDDKEHTADVDSVSIEHLKNGKASIEVNGQHWIPYCHIVQKAKQPTLIEFAFGQLGRFFKRNMVFTIV